MYCFYLFRYTCEYWNYPYHYHKYNCGGSGSVDSCSSVSRTCNHYLVAEPVSEHFRHTLTTSCTCTVNCNPSIHTCTHSLSHTHTHTQKCACTQGGRRPLCKSWHDISLCLNLIGLCHDFFLFFVALTIKY